MLSKLNDGLTNPPLPVEQADCDERVCVSFVCTDISRTTRPIFTEVSCMLPVAVARCSSVGVAIRFLVPVLMS